MPEQKINRFMESFNVMFNAAKTNLTFVEFETFLRNVTERIDNENRELAGLYEDLSFDDGDSLKREKEIRSIRRVREKYLEKAVNG